MLLPFHLVPAPLWKALYHCDGSFQVDTVLPERDARTSQEMLGHLCSLSDVEGCLYQGREPLLVTQSWVPSLWASHQRSQVLPYKDLKYEFHLCLSAAHCQPEVVSHWESPPDLLWVPFAKAHFQGDGPMWSREHMGGQPARAPGTRVPVLAMLLTGCSSFAYWQLTLSSK